MMSEQYAFVHRLVLVSGTVPDDVQTFPSRASVAQEVQWWAREHHKDPNDYVILTREVPAWRVDKGDPE